jgi:beta-N-acetylhexosaminidase
MVKKCGIKYMEAAKECGTVTAVKHFPGDGVDEVDQHILTSVNTLSCEEWDKTFGDVYQTMIDAGTLTVMIGHIAMPAYQKKFNPNHPKKLMPASLSPELLKNLLRDQLGFNGMIITDASPMVGFLCAMDREKSVPYCIESGCDMLLFNKDYAEDITFMTKGYENGILSEKRLNEAVTRILAKKAALQLHVKRKRKELILPKEESFSIIGCKEHMDQAKECADQAITLVKDTQGLLPLSSENIKEFYMKFLENVLRKKELQRSFLN